jgi:uncharacterized OB-fold protein
MSGSDAPRSLPAVTPEDAFFWQGGADGALHILRCRSCRYYVHPPMPICPRCRSHEVADEAVSGQGRVASFTVNHQAWRPGLATPYVVAIVELAEQQGLRLTTNIVNCPIELVHIGLSVRVVFEQIEDIWLPLFEPAPEGVE